MEIEELELLGIDGEIQKHIIIRKSETEFTSMPKALWDELEAKREQSGTLS